ncbi:MAG: hypothetical protein K6A40_06180 [Solobacterium sp.]|nr:hypothetical protein [Solobacterium sp.]
MYKDEYVISDIHERSYMITNRATKVISMVRPVLEENAIQFKPLAYIIFDIDVARFLRQNKNDQIRFTIFDQKGNMQMPANLVLDSAQEQAMIQLVTSDKYSRTVYDSFGLPRNMLIHSDLEAFAIDLIGIRDLSALTWIIRVYLFVIVVVLGTALILIWPISKKMANDILKPMAQLVRECNEVASGIKLEQFSEKESREIAFLSDTIENMVGRLSELTNQLAEEKVRLS